MRGEPIEVYSIEPAYTVEAHDGMTREEIYFGLIERTPHLRRRACTPRVMSESGVDALLDKLVELQHEEGFELLLDEQEVGYGL